MFDGVISTERKEAGYVTFAIMIEAEVLLIWRLSPVYILIMVMGLLLR